ncbi:MAG TPA: rhodanese-like domain-containing protein, partial [Gemmatimonadales bacterium]
MTAALPDVPEITADQLRAELEQGRPLAVVDVRRAADWSEWSVPGSVNTGGIAGVASYTPAPGARVITVCGMGNSSRRAAHELIARGVNAVSLKGGMSGWSLAWNVAEVTGLGGKAQVVQVRRTGKGCLSYLVVSAGQAAVIDPSVDPEVYVGLAKARAARIVAVFDTHVHADHLSRGRTLATATGAQLYMPEQNRVRFVVRTLDDGGQVEVGDATITAMRTPGHTFESTCYGLDDTAVMTGDTLFLDSV